MALYRYALCILLFICMTWSLCDAGCHASPPHYTVESGLGCTSMIEPINWTTNATEAFLWCDAIFNCTIVYEEFNGTLNYVLCKGCTRWARYPTQRDMFCTHRRTSCRTIDPPRLYNTISVMVTTSLRRCLRPCHFIYGNATLACDVSATEVELCDNIPICKENGTCMDSGLRPPPYERHIEITHEWRCIRWLELPPRIRVDHSGQDDQKCRIDYAISPSPYCIIPFGEHPGATIHECFVHICAPVDATVGPWGQWGTCTVTCGQGERTRRRTCNTTERLGGEPCPTTGMSMMGPCMPAPPSCLTSTRRTFTTIPTTTTSTAGRTTTEATELAEEQALVTPTHVNFILAGIICIMALFAIGMGVGIVWFYQKNGRIPWARDEGDGPPPVQGATAPAAAQT